MLPQRNATSSLSFRGIGRTRLRRQEARVEVEHNVRSTVFFRSNEATRVWNYILFFREEGRVG